ncbi:hypothetical protein R5R35_007282 [Gryllus longicercus]|uniref:Neuropeptide SIFamide n=1 Tax=Gryllus longicercus TaxID=2509291 RepID=A0AAN9YWZ7_9ORTH|nr:Neuropeptide SIFamide [Gryllus bimaculatus]
MAGKSFAASRRSARPLAALLRAAAVLCVALLLVAASAPSASSYRKPPFNGSIFGKRAPAAAAAPAPAASAQDYEAAAAGKALSALCEVAAEACSAWFPQQNELN